MGPALKRSNCFYPDSFKLYGKTFEIDIDGKPTSIKTQQQLKRMYISFLKRRSSMLFKLRRFQPKRQKTKQTRQTNKYLKQVLKSEVFTLVLQLLGIGTREYYNFNSTCRQARHKAEYEGTPVPIFNLAQRQFSNFGSRKQQQRYFDQRNFSGRLVSGDKSKSQFDWTQYPKSTFYKEFCQQKKKFIYTGVFVASLRFLDQQKSPIEQEYGHKFVYFYSRETQLDVLLLFNNLQRGSQFKRTVSGVMKLGRDHFIVAKWVFPGELAPNSVCYEYNFSNGYLARYIVFGSSCFKSGTFEKLDKKTRYLHGFVKPKCQYLKSYYKSLEKPLGSKVSGFVTNSKHAFSFEHAKPALSCSTNDQDVFTQVINDGVEFNQPLRSKEMPENDQETYNRLWAAGIQWFLTAYNQQRRIRIDNLVFLFTCENADFQIVYL